MRILDYCGPATNADGQETVNHSQHVAAVSRDKTNAHGRAMMHLLTAWESYAKAHKQRFESNIGSDGVIGVYWAEVGLAIKRLLDGETGGLDCGSIAHNITAMIETEGFKTDGYTLTGE